METSQKVGNNPTCDAGRLLHYGFSVFPLNGGTATDADKEPHRTLLPKDAKRKPTWKPFQTSFAIPDELDYWTEHDPRANYAIATGALSGVIVLDIDSDVGQIDAERRGLPNTVTARTASGRHYYFRHPGFACGNKGKRRGGFPDGMDFRGDGGYVVAPGSVHPSGTQYRWEIGRSPDDIEFADAPSWLLDLVRKQKDQTGPRGELVRPVGIGNDRYAEVALNRELDNVQRSLPGNRNDTLNAAAFSIGTLLGAGRGLDLGSVEELFVAAAVSTGLPESEARDVTARALRDGIAKPRSMPAVTPTRIRTDQQSKDTDIPSQETTEGFYTLDDVGNAQRFAARYREVFLYDFSAGLWRLFDGTRYAPDLKGHVRELAEALTWEMSEVAVALKDDALTKHASRSRSNKAIQAMIEGARSKPEIAILHDELDRNPWLLNVDNATLDLRSDAVREHDAGDRMTKLAPVMFDPNAQCPQFVDFLAQIIPDEEVRRYVQSRIGYSLTGITREQELYISYGLGSNGKSTLYELIRDMLGDYGHSAAFHTFLARRDDTSPRADLAELQGKRFALAAESNEGRRLDEAMIKAVTGGERIRTRRPHSPREIEYAPEFKIFLSTNHRPDIVNDDHAIWRRVKVIPFTVTIPDGEQDRNLSAKLRGELSGILNWTLDGMRLWRSGEVREPEAVSLATQSYREDSDIVGQFISDCLTINPAARATLQQVRDAYARWCQENREMAIGPRELTKRLKDKGYKDGKSGAIRYWQSIGIREDRPGGDVGQNSGRYGD